MESRNDVKQKLIKELQYIRNLITNPEMASFGGVESGVSQLDSLLSNDYYRDVLEHSSGVQQIIKRSIQ